MPGHWHLQDFPDLPAGDYWSGDVLRAHEILQNAYQQALQLLRQEDGDPLRLQIHSDQINRQMVPLLEALQHKVDDVFWVGVCAHQFGELLSELENAALRLSAEGREESTADLIQIIPMQLRAPGPNRGRPCFEFDQEWLADAVSPARRISLQTLARMLGVHRNTLRNHLQMNGLFKRFSDITDQELDVLIRHYKLDRPNAGLRFVIASLKAHGLHVQRERIRLSMQRIIRRRTTVQRRAYEVPRSNYLWHIDGHHKLIRWGLVIHGMIDGFCRTVVGLRASPDNRASTVLSVFLDATHEYGTPSRVRGDRGGENMDVAIWMVQHRGPNRSSFLWGKSTRNSRIERLWVDVGVQFVRRWRAFFMRLEDSHMLDASDPDHHWLLHHLFLEQLNNDCEQFQQDWNYHPISKRGHNRTPLDMRFLSEVQHGTYIECHETHPEIMARSGSSHIDLEAEIAADQHRHVRHPAADVPPTTMPFNSDQAYEAFILALQEIQDQEVIPMGYGVAEEEWEDGSYPEVGVISVGRSRKEYEVEMPFSIWWTRAVSWAQGLDVMTRIRMIEDGEL